MMKSTDHWMTARVGLAACLVFLGLSLSPHARADMMLHSDTTMIQGTQSDIFSFDAPSAGTVTARLQNQDWTAHLTSLSFQATTATDTLSSFSAPANDSSVVTQTFEVGPGTYFAHILASAGGPFDVGLYTLSLSFSPVPLPASDWMLMFGVLILFGLSRLLSGLKPFQSLDGDVPAAG
jgi:hypothetical protein